MTMKFTNLPLTDYQLKLLFEILQDPIPLTEAHLLTSEREFDNWLRIKEKVERLCGERGIEV